MKDKVLLGTLRRRSLYLPTWRGWLFFLLVLGLGGFLFVRNIYAFLAKEDRMPQADILIVEAWVNDTNIAMAYEEWKAGRCKAVVSAGVEIDQGQMLQEYGNWGELTAARLRKLGVPPENALGRSAGKSQRNRTFSSATAVKKLIEDKGLPHATINVLTEGNHSRRTAMVFRKVFGDSAKLAFIVAPPDDYDPASWWKTSAGVKSMIMETIATTYEWLGNGGR